MDVLVSRRLGLDLDEACMDEFLDTDMLSANCNLEAEGYMDNDWLDSLFEDPVLNDKMITEAAMLTRLQPTDHSYSSINDPSSTDSILGFDDFSSDLESDLLSTALDLSQKQVPTIISTTHIQSLDSVYSATPMTTMTIKQEPIDFTMETISKNTMTTITTPGHKSHTIILTTPLATGSHLKTDRMFLPKNSIKIEPVDSLDHSSGLSILDSSLLPPTPPSSASSDSEGSQSPGRSSPSSPYRHLTSKHATTYMSKDLTPLFTSPIPTSGYLVLSEEEKRTLITEGYPVPAKLPLTKQEEKNLKKVRRKIKNKISAQESRRKKKEYMEALEKRVEVFSQENGDLKKKVDNLETNNRSLLGQLQKLQALVGKMPRPSVPPTTQAGSVLMVLVLCFAMFLGSGTWSPTSLNIGYSSPVHQQPMPDFYNKPQPIHPSPVMGPGIERVLVDQYSTPNVKSRVLLSLRDEYDSLIGPEIPGVSHERRECQIEKPEDGQITDSANVYEPNVIIPHDSEDKLAKTAEEKQTTSLVIQPPSQKVLVDARVPQVNDSADAKLLQALMHPDIATTADIITIGNITAATETVS